MKSVIAWEECIKDIWILNEKIEEAVKGSKFDSDGGLLVEGFEMEEQLMDMMID